MIRKNNSTKKGFTLVEMAFSIVFISFLLLAIAYLIFHVNELFTKGIAIKDISSTGRELIDEFSRSIALSSSPLATSSCKYTSNSEVVECRDKDHARKFIYQERKGDVDIKGVRTTVPVHGVFCTGYYSYVWNTGYALNPTDYKPSEGKDLSAKLQIKTQEYSDFRLLKVMDTEKKICKDGMNTGSYQISNPTVAMPYTYNYDDTTAEVTELLDGSENNLVLYDLSIFKPAQQTLTQQTYFSGTFILATMQGSVNIKGNGEYCKDAPDGWGTDFNYCSLNKYNFAMRATGQER
ncbi:MAG: hypothetical protein Q4E47_02100 [Candidatus Saccharibacteria bacterium]|nr:hypothetical protein [Candidatus Saccharibacteria bacterium]